MARSLGLNRLPRLERAPLYGSVGMEAGLLVKSQTLPPRADTRYSLSIHRVRRSRCSSSKLRMANVFLRLPVRGAVHLIVG
eukprot:758244-Pleurochrysis_carterae.AAC.2